MTVVQDTQVEHRAISRGQAMSDKRLQRFLSQARSASLAYTRRDGSAFVVPVWFRWMPGPDGGVTGTVQIRTVPSDPKVAAIRRASKVSVLVHDDRPPYRVAIIDGPAHIDVLEPGLPDPTDDLAVHYLGRIGGKVFDRQMIEAGEFDAGRAIITVVPEVIRTNDGPATLSWFDRAYAAVRYRLPVPNGWL